MRVSKEQMGVSKIIQLILVLKNSYGYKIIEKVWELSNGKTKWNNASIYPVLKRIEASGGKNGKINQLIPA